MLPPRASARERITVLSMYAITISEPGGPEVLTWTKVPDPTPGDGEVLLDVAASAVNRADLLQRQGHYPPPPGASDIIGLECSGTIAELGAGVTGWQVGDQVCALLAGGGYARACRRARGAAACRCPRVSTWWPRPDCPRWRAPCGRTW